MKLNKIVFIFIVLFSIGITAPVFAQVKGGRKKEHRNQRPGGAKLFGGKSRGNANSFAKGGHRRGFLARVFKGNKSGSAWAYHRTRPGRVQNREQPHLFKRNRTKGKRFTDGIIAQQNRQRTLNRKRGNKVFAKKKH